MTGLLPTSHIKVSRGRVAHAFHVRRHTLVLPLVRLLAVLDLQGTWKMTTLNKDETGRERGRKKKKEKDRETGSREEMISQSVCDSA